MYNTRATWPHLRANVKPGVFVQRMTLTFPEFKRAPSRTHNISVLPDNVCRTKINSLIHHNPQIIQTVVAMRIMQKRLCFVAERRNKRLMTRLLKHRARDAENRCGDAQLHLHQAKRINFAGAATSQF